MAVSVMDVVGNTPVVELKRIAREEAENSARVFAKLEFLNPSGSIKDRMVAYAIKSAERKGILKPGSIVVEATSGNTGIALSMISATRGYRAIIVAPETTSEEKIRMMKAFGAKLILTPAEKGMKEPAHVAKEIAKRKKAFLLNQFENCVMTTSP